MSKWMALILLGVANVSYAKILDYASFEQEVVSKNKSVMALKNNVDAYSKKIDEPSLLVSPQIFANFFYSHDERETINPQYTGIYTNSRSYELGIKQQTPWGQQYSLSYTALYNDLHGSSLPYATAYDVGPKIELTQSLWRNFFGTETRAQQQLIKAQNSLSYYQDLFNYRQKLREAKLLYLNYFISRESLRLQKEALKRANEIRDWTKRRSQKELGEESDYLQAQAQVLSKEFEVKSAENQLAIIAKKFQLMRGEEQGEFSDDVKPFKVQEILSIAKTKEYKARADLEIFKSQMELVKNQSIVSAERYKPQLEFYGQMLYQGRERSYTAAKEEAWDKDNEWWAVGVRFSAPLFFLDSWGTVSAYNTQEQSAMEQITHRENEAYSEWKRLNEELVNQKAKFSLSEQLAVIQKKKSEVERKKLKQGRTTTYQVLTFELDYLNAELLFLKSQFDLLNVATELALYE